ncbi:MaoC like domain-containing protein [Bradyrhizobium sp. Rc2d]|uniref:MaoC/PaaZ C-terminal domain-containing protein n=1 Tax=Bradyrhizobium sp. Rc2d TaxID=1855321 RepID=UPI000892402F|nr:MaoC/PaaZ C-terminal domain-containing protein [Bradyrhizobium sp. Rc2d]SDI26818.1 MaoC like domain-containing protein [Bradyrhizobium sp. Rc2d]
MNQMQPDAESPTKATALRVARAIDLAAFVGTELAPGRWRSVTQDEVDQFVALTGDRNWVHTDVERARRELDGATIVPGQLLLALVPALLQEAYVVSGAAQSRAAALRSVRFRCPVRPGDNFRLRARLTLVEQRPRFVQVDVSCDLELNSGQCALKSQRTDVFFD